MFPSPSYSLNYGQWMPHSQISNSIQFVMLYKGVFLLQSGLLLLLVVKGAAVILSVPMFSTEDVVTLAVEA